MRAIKYLFFVALTVFALTACKKDNGGNNGGGGNDEPEFVAAVTIDGNMSEWAGIEGVSTAETDTSPYRTLKVTYDEKYIYFYSKRLWNNDAIWGGGYYYYCIDNIPDAGDPDVNGQHTFSAGIDTWFYVFLFLGTADSPQFASSPTGGCSAEESFIEHIVSAGKINNELTEIETEIRVPREDLNIQKGQEVHIYSWGNKSGEHFRSNSALTVKIEK